ncbi:MAG: hypothetical protein FJ207_06175 [Gemmatimonadetes bacterium]|nr:hypothetical protein [Gemmatimonadota bacterium]
MEANRARRRWTYEEYARLPMVGDGSGYRYEVIDDELVVTASPGTRHQRIAARLAALLFPFVETHQLGEPFATLDVLFGEGD